MLQAELPAAVARLVRVSRQDRSIADSVLIMYFADDGIDGSQAFRLKLGDVRNVERNFNAVEAYVADFHVHLLEAVIPAGFGESISMLRRVRPRP